jgi:hypothetical protein
VTIRELKAEEFPMLKVVADGFVPDPRISVAVIAENGEGAIVGRILALQPVHLEGTWVDEKHRRTPLAHRMFRFMETQLKQKYRLTHVMAFSAEPVITEYLRRLGYTDHHLTVLSREL